MTQMRKTAYLKILGLDVVGAGALLYWIVGMDSEAGNNLLIPVLVYFLANQMKRKPAVRNLRNYREDPDEPGRSV